MSAPGVRTPDVEVAVAIDEVLGNVIDNGLRRTRRASVASLINQVAGSEAVGGALAEERLTRELMIAEEATARATGDQQVLQAMTFELTAMSGEIGSVRQLAETGLKPMRGAARVLVTTNVNIASGLVAGTVIDGVTLVVGDRVALVGQTNASQNGIYVAPASGAAVRAGDADTADELLGARFEVQAGSHSGETWALQTTGEIVVGTTALVFVLAASANAVAAEVQDARGPAGSLPARLDTIAAEARAGASVGASVNNFPAPPSANIASTDAAPGTLVIGINGGLRLEPTSSTGIYGLETDIVVGARPQRIDLDYTYTASTGAGTRTIGIGVGSGSARKWFTWSAAGTLVRRSQSNSTEMTFAAASSARMTYNQGDQIGMSLIVNGDGTGLLEIRLASGEVEAYGLESVPTGRLYVGAGGAAGNVWTVTQMRAYGAAVAVPAVSDAIRDGQDRLDSLVGRSLVTQTTGAARRYYNARLSGGAAIITRAAGTGASLQESPALMSAVRDSGGPMIFEATFAPSGSTSTISCNIAVGSGAARRWYIWASTGAVIDDFDDDTVAEWLANADASRSYTHGDTVTMRLVIEADRSGKLIIVPPTGPQQEFPISDIPSGPVAVGARTGEGNSVAISDIKWTGSVTRLAQQAGGGGSTSLALLRYHLLPDASASRVPKGMTSTGLDRITRGIWTGCWLVADDGRLVEGDASPFVPGVFVITPDWRQVLAAFPMPWSGASAQGVAVDTSGAADTFWVAASGDNTIRHFHLYGPSAGDEIGADVFDWAAAGYDSRPNGLAYDPTNHALLAGVVSGTTVRMISCDPDAVPRLIGTYTVTATSPDQFHLDPARRLLYYSTGANGTDGIVRVLNLLTSQDTIAYGPLPLAQAIEGIYIDQTAGVLTVLNDGGFHAVAQPALNIAIEYSVPLSG